MWTFALFLACENGKTVTVRNSDPEAVITSHAANAEVYELTEEMFQGSVSDLNDNATELRTSWFIDERPLCIDVAPTVDGLTVCTSRLEVDEQVLRLQVTDTRGATFITEQPLTVIAVEAPEVSWFKPIEEDIYYSDRVISFSAEVSDKEDLPSEVGLSWESSIDGDLNTLPGFADDAGYAQGSANLSPGEHILTLRAEDTHGKTANLSRVIRVQEPSSPPSCSIESPLNEDVFLQGEIVSLVGTVYDPDVGYELLRVHWESSLDGNLGAGTFGGNDTVILNTSNLSTGLHTIALNVEDDTNETCVSSIWIYVSTPPTVSLEAPSDGSVFSLGEEIIFEGQVMDLEDPPNLLGISWSSSLDGVLSNDASDIAGKASFRTSDLQVGTHTIVLEAIDVSGLKASDSLELTINTPPDTPQVDITPSPATSADDLTVRILSSSDADGDALSYSYTWIRNGVIESQTASTSATEDSLVASDTAVGDTWTVQVFASDAYSQSDVAELSVEVVNSPPTITDAEIAPATAYNDSVLACSATVADIDQAITPTYTWSVGSDTYTGASLDLGFLSVMPNESVTCSIEATDNNGSSVSVETGISIANRDPQISSIVLQPSNGIVADSTVECVVTATDPDGETPIVSHSWSNGSALGISNPITLDPSVVSRGETLSCTGTATDGYGGTDSSSVTADIENSQPQIASFSLTPSAPTADEVVTCSFTASDIDGDTLTAQFSWDNQDTGQNYTSTSASGLTSTLDLGTVSIQGTETLSCSVTVSDGHGLQDTASQSVIVQNEGPTFTVEAEISPDSGVYIGTELSCHAEATDSEDGVSTIAYSWSSAGTVLGTGATYTVSSTDVAVGDTITCTATAEDSLGASSTSEASLVVENTAPQLSSVSISPDPLYNTDLATCSATVTDPDETLVPSYVWTLGGQIVGTSADLQLDTSISSPFDSLECSVSVTDSSGIFVDAAATVILGNRPPSAPSVRISPTTPVVQDDLLCVIDTASIDADGDTVAYTYVWEKAGVIQASYSTDTIPASELDYGDTWTCTVTPTDGFDIGSSSSASVSIQDACSNTDCDLTVLFPNGTGIDFVLISGGSFAMGSPSGETGRKSDETLHNVTLTNNFYMMTTEMNQVMFDTLMGYNPGSFASCGVECPIEMVSWYEAAHFANELTTYFNDEWGTTLDQCYSCNFNSAGVLSSCTAAVSPVYDCNGFRLPTEAEWEYAARAESTTAFDTPNGGGSFDDPTYILSGCGSTTLDDGTSLDDMAWYCSNSANSVQVMASKEPNSWGLYDMHGNIAEWCHDWYDNKFGMSTVGAATDPEGAATGSQKVIRGGYWSNPPQRTRSAARASYNPSAQFNSYGFRLVMTEW